MTATDDTRTAVSAALARAATQLLESELDGPFWTISYPPGYNFFVQAGQPVFYNPATLGVIDQLCTKDASGIVKLTGSRFSTKYADILKNVVYKLSTSDQHNLDTLRARFSKQTTAVVSAYETTFGTITQQQIDCSKCWPAVKIGYIEYIINTKYAGDPEKISPAYADFGSSYIQWLSLSTELREIASRQYTAQGLVAAAIEHTISPSAASSAWQTGASSFGVAYMGLPAINKIVGSLSSNDRKLTVTLELTNRKSKTLDMSQGGESAIQMPEALVSIDLGQSKGTVSRSLSTLDGSASKVVLSIIYPGITVLQANPLELSADLATGWYSESILSDVVQKTGHDVSGFQLYGSDLSVSDLFGEGKMFARVKTFVVSQEPTIQLTFFESDPNAIKNNFKPDTLVRLGVAGVFFYGMTSSGLNVQKVDVADGNTVVTLAPPNVAGTIPVDQQTAHVIGGVLDYPPTISADIRAGAITVKNSGGFVASFSIQYSQDDKSKIETSGAFPALVAKTLQLPADATDILIIVQIATFIDTWSVVNMYRFDRPVTKTFELTGATGNPMCSEV